MSVQASSVITQVAPEGGIHQQPHPHGDYDLGGPQHDINIKLHARGTTFDITRNELMKLPESILLSLFPNGVFVDLNGNVIPNLSDQDIVAINFSPDCLKYTLDVFRDAEAQYLATNGPATESSPEQQPHQWSPSFEDASVDMLRTKPAIVVLKEDLDYFCLPPSPKTTEAEMRELKMACGAQLVQRDGIFSGLKRGNERGSAEQHLVEMLCNSGFSLDDTWGFRSIEPGRAVIGSLALVLLGSSSPGAATGSDHGKDLDSDNEKDSREDNRDDHSREDNRDDHSRDSEHDHDNDNDNDNPHHDNPHHDNPHHDNPHHDHDQELAEDDLESTRHKLLLFWRKPARKCWWDSVKLEGIPGYDNPITVHIRRVWTLELSVIGI